MCGHEPRDLRNEVIQKTVFLVRMLLHSKEKSPSPLWAEGIFLVAGAGLSSARQRTLPLVHRVTSKLAHDFTALHEPATTHASRAVAEPNPSRHKAKEKCPTRKG